MKYGVKSSLMYNDKRYAAGEEVDIKEKAEAERLMGLDVIEAIGKQAKKTAETAEEKTPAAAGKTAEEEEAETGGGVKLPDGINPNLQ